MKFVWGGECLHGLCNRGRATQFPMPIGMAAAFDPGLLQRVASAVGDEIRAIMIPPGGIRTNRIWSGTIKGSRCAKPFAPVSVRICRALGWLHPGNQHPRHPRWGVCRKLMARIPI